MSDRSDGYGSGSGYGYGYGFGYVDGFGFGYGYDDDDDGYGTTIGIVSGHRVTSLAPWNYVLVGCQCHSVEWWRDNWRYTAKENEVSVSESEVEDVLCKLTSYAAE